MGKFKVKVNTAFSKSMKSRVNKLPKSLKVPKLKLKGF